MSKHTPMTPKDASRIQSHSDRTGRNQDFKGRAQSAGSRNEPPPAGGSSSPPAPEPNGGTGK